MAVELNWVTACRSIAYLILAVHYLVLDCWVSVQIPAAVGYTITQQPYAALTCAPVSWYGNNADMHGMQPMLLLWSTSPGMHALPRAA